jgi:hypothetical protein
VCVNTSLLIDYGSEYSDELNGRDYANVNSCASIIYDNDEELEKSSV